MKNIVNPGEKSEESNFAIEVFDNDGNMITFRYSDVTVPAFTEYYN